MPVDDIEPNSLTRTVVLVVAERARRDGKYTAHCNGLLVVTNSTQPFLDAARALLAQGFDPAARYVMRRSPDGPDALISTLGQAAKLTVEETDRGGTRFRPWKVDTRWAVPSRIAQNTQELPSPPVMGPAALQGTLSVDVGAALPGLPALPGASLGPTGPA